HHHRGLLTNLNVPHCSSPGPLGRCLRSRFLRVRGCWWTAWITKQCHLSTLEVLGPTLVGRMEDFFVPLRKSLRRRRNLGHGRRQLHLNPQWPISFSGIVKVSAPTLKS